MCVALGTSLDSDPSIIERAYINYSWKEGAWKTPFPALVYNSMKVDVLI